MPIDTTPIRSLKARVLVVDDDASTREVFGELLQRWGYDVEQTGDGHDALKLITERHPDVIIITGKGTIDAAVEAVREGVFDFVEKPVDPARLKVILQSALEKRQTEHEMQVLR